MSEQKLSKYAAKVKRRETQTLAAIDVAVKITEKQSLPTIRTPHPTTPRRNMEIGDLGELPAKCADALTRAANLLSFAETCAQKMVEASASPYQTAEPRCIAAFCLSTRLRVMGMASRAGDVPTRKEAANAD